MRFAVGLLASFAAVAVAADASSSSSPAAPTPSSDAATQECLNKCNPTADVVALSKCRCKCMPEGDYCPGPTYEQAKANNECVAKNCQNMEAEPFANCLMTCQKANYFDPASGTPEQSGSSDNVAVSSGASQPTATQSGGASQTSSSGPSATTSKNAGVAVAGSSGAFLGALAALLAL